jgi:hypothetical protein
LGRRHELLVQEARIQRDVDGLEDLAERHPDEAAVVPVGDAPVVGVKVTGLAQKLGQLEAVKKK